MVITGTGEVYGEPWPAGALYHGQLPKREAPLLAVPYSAWDNREPGAMRVWMPYEPKREKAQRIP